MKIAIVVFLIIAFAMTNMYCGAVFHKWAMATSWDGDILVWHNPKAAIISFVVFVANVSWVGAAFLSVALGKSNGLN